MIWLGITAIIVVFVFIVILCWIDVDSAPYLLYGAILMLALFGGLFLIIEHYNPSIKPIDVYRGKTTLEITYRDSVAMDSVVVYKMK